MSSIISNASLLVVLLILATLSFYSEARSQKCKPSGKLRGIDPPPGKCSGQNNAECCVAGKFHPVFECSPPVSKKTKAILTLNSFQEGGDGGGASKCDGEFHDDSTPVVALSTGWFSNGDRCNNKIRISAGGKSVVAVVVDECDSTLGCDEEHDFQPPCRNNIVDGSPAVWEALGVAEEDQGLLDITSLERILQNKPTILPSPALLGHLAVAKL